MTDQPLAYVGDVTGDLWACAACGAAIDLAHVIHHRDDCQWIEELVEKRPG